MRRRAARIAGALVVCGGVAAAGIVVSRDGSEAAATPEGSPARLSTGTIERRTLVDRQTVAGTLGYGPTRSVFARLAGTVSWLPAEGSTVRPGRPIAKIDGSPIVLLRGSVPAYRSLQPGVGDGADVRQLEQALADLGYDPGVVDAAWTSATTAAVRSWQDDLGLDATGTVELGRVVFLPGSRRIASREVEVGAVVGGGSSAGAGGAASSEGAATELLTTTSTTRLVTLDLDAGDQELAKAGDAVQVELPGGDRIPGRVDEVGTVATSASGDDPQGQDGGGDDDATIAVTVRLTGRETGEGLDAAPVSVDLSRSVRRGVLAAPIPALVARRGGGYALDVIERGRRRLVPVRTGVFADGFVEVSGAGLRAGTSIAVPAQ